MKILNFLKQKNFFFHKSGQKSWIFFFFITTSLTTFQTQINITIYILCCLAIFVKLYSARVYNARTIHKFVINFFFFFFVSMFNNYHKYKIIQDFFSFFAIHLHFFLCFYVNRDLHFFFSNCKNNKQEY